jgi:hypothetical protein
VNDLHIRRGIYGSHYYIAIENFQSSFPGDLISLFNRMISNVALLLRKAQLHKVEMVMDWMYPDEGELLFATYFSYSAYSEAGG